MTPPCGLRDTGTIECEYLADSPVLSTLPDSNLLTAVLIPECPGMLPKRKGLFKHPVLIKHEPPEYLFPAGGVVFRHHIQRRIKEIEPLLVFPGIQDSYTLPPVLVKSGDRSFPCSCMFSDDCICHGNYSPEIHWFPNDFSLIKKYFVLNT